MMLAAITISLAGWCILIGLLLVGVISVYSLIRRQRVVWSACLLGASVGGLLAFPVGIQFHHELVSIFNFWSTFMISIGLRGVVFGPWVPYLYDSLVIVSGMAFGAAVGWRLAQRKE
jgi:hypothetical protein